jgi:thiol-disulfide isomerase/thioredoxin
MNSSNSKSFLKIISLSEFEVSFNELLNNKANFFGYFYGSYDTEGWSWCGDCNISKPVIEEASKLLENQDKVLLVKFPIERSDWKNSSFVYRVHPKLKLEKVPTLIYFQSGVEFGRLVEEELADSSNVKEFFQQSLEI